MKLSEFKEILKN